MHHQSLRQLRIDNEIRRRLRAVINIGGDDIVKDILTYIILNEPITLYKVSKSISYATSTVYKKAKKMLNYGLIRPLNGSTNHGNMRGTYESTVKGLLACLAYECIDDELIISKLCHKWRMDHYCQEAPKIINVLPIILRRSGVSIVEQPEALMINALNSLSELRGIINEEYIKDIEHIATHYVTNRLLLNDKGAIMLVSGKFVININVNYNYAYIYTCMLCNRHCLTKYLMLNDGECYVLRSIIESLRQSLTDTMSQLPLSST